MNIALNLKKLFVVVGATLLVLLTIFPKKIVHEVSQLSPTEVSEILTPKSIEELQTIVRSSRKPISIAGGKFSQGWANSISTGRRNRYYQA